MGFLDFLEKIGGFFGFRNFSEEDRYIKAIYAALSEAGEELKNYNEAIEHGKKAARKAGAERNIYAPKDLGKFMEEGRLENKATVLIELKKKINRILREF